MRLAFGFVLVLAAGCSAFDRDDSPSTQPGTTNGVGADGGPLATPGTPGNGASVPNATSRVDPYVLGSHLAVQADATGAIDVAPPEGAVAGDVLFVVWRPRTIYDLVLPSGWTELQRIIIGSDTDSARSSVWFGWHRLVAGETSATRFTFTSALSGRSQLLAQALLRNVRDAEPFAIDYVTPDITPTVVDTFGIQPTATQTAVGFGLYGIVVPQPVRIPAIPTLDVLESDAGGLALFGTQVPVAAGTALPAVSAQFKITTGDVPSPLAFVAVRVAQR